MPFLRLLIAWMLLLALPLQGLAGVSMLQCESFPAVQAATDDGHAVHHGHAHASHSDQDDAFTAAAEAEAGHSCAACAACAASCHAMAPGGLPGVQPVALPQHRTSVPAPLAGGPALPIPDKPPRA